MLSCTMGTLSFTLEQIKSFFSMHLEMPCSCGFQAKNSHAVSFGYIGRYKEGITPSVKQETILTPSFENTTSCRTAEIRNQEFRK